MGVIGNCRILKAEVDVLHPGGAASIWNNISPTKFHLKFLTLNNFHAFPLSLISSHRIIIFKIQIHG